MECPICGSDELEILNSKELSLAYKTNFGTFIHPEYNKTQIYVKGN